MSLDFQGAGGIIAAFGAFAGAQGQQSALRNQADLAGINPFDAPRCNRRNSAPLGALLSDVWRSALG